MNIFRVRYSFRDGRWCLCSARRTNEYASVVVQSVEHKRAGQAYLPVLSAAEDAATPYAAVCSHLASLTLVEKCRRAAMLRLAGEVRSL